MPRLCDICGSSPCVGKQKLTADESPNPGTYKLCEWCAEDTERVGGTVIYYRYSKQYKERQAAEVTLEDIPPGTECNDCTNTNIVAKQTLTSEESPHPGTYLLCPDCAVSIEEAGGNITYFKESDIPKSTKETLPDEVINCNHEWHKHSNVSEFDKYKEGIFDWYRCEKCRVYGKSFGISLTTPIDLTMEIDISCSR
ncbi:hypothetical protein F7U66_18730 [Vibrio parahaemolyticus]|nr:hypothetical protein [Vibrio parahaemolyticus]